MCHLCGWHRANKADNNSRVIETRAVDNKFEINFNDEDDDEALSELFTEDTGCISDQLSDAECSSQFVLCTYCGELENVDDNKANCIQRISNTAKCQVTDELRKSLRDDVNTLMIEIAMQMLTEWWDRHENSYKLDCERRRSFLCYLCGWKAKSDQTSSEIKPIPKLDESTPTKEAITGVSIKSEITSKNEFDDDDADELPVKELWSMTVDNEFENDMIFKCESTAEMSPEASACNNDRSPNELSLCAYCGELENVDDLEINWIQRVSNTANEQMAAELKKTLRKDVTNGFVKSTMKLFSEWWETKRHDNAFKLEVIPASKAPATYNTYLEKKRISVESAKHRPVALTKHNTHRLSQRLGCQLIPDEYIHSFELRKSNIHGLGLFAKRKFENKDVVIEYKGELITRMEANRRERAYRRQGKSNCYLFTVWGSTVIDATVRGNLARYINHSCDVSIHFCFSTISLNLHKLVNKSISSVKFVQLQMEISNTLISVHVNVIPTIKKYVN